MLSSSFSLYSKLAAYADIMSKVRKVLRVIYAVLIIGIGGYCILEVYPFVWRDFIDPDIIDDKSASQKSAFFPFFFGLFCVVYGIYELINIYKHDS